jgi:hypothetical protein
MSRGRRRYVSDFAPRPEEARELADAWGNLAFAAVELRRCERATARAVHEARDAGLSWARIGYLLGVSKQAAQQRYSRPSRSVDVSGGADGR